MDLQRSRQLLPQQDIGRLIFVRRRTPARILGALFQAVVTAFFRGGPH